MSFSVTNILLLVLFVITVVNLILLFVNNYKVKKYKDLYDKALAKFNSHTNILDEFNSIYSRLNEVENKANNTMDSVNNFNEKMKSNVQKIGFVKYNAYDETENKLSFALALLDERENGILINHIYSKHGSNIYAKLVEAGEVEDRISDEESLALKIAHEDKEFKTRTVSNVPKKVKVKKNK